MRDEHWQLQVSSKSLKKREKLALLDKHLKIDPSATILDLGCAQGILSYYLRKKGGTWLSTDLDFTNLLTSSELLKKNLIQTPPDALPLKSDSLNQVVSLDYLEHLDDDLGCLIEIQRCLKPGGKLILAVPRTGKLFVLHRIRPLLGMKLEFYGHKREGYSLTDLKTLLAKADLEYVQHRTFSGFLTELAELLLNFVYTRFFPSGDSEGLRDGHIRPTTATEFTSQAKAFKAYAWVYPLVWLGTRLDKLFFWQRNYGLIIWAGKRPSSD
jgi:2-polyprenyl-3-methyl-5-hydroxy-6-metoxy-1,4-benzoquinol methylase